MKTLNDHNKDARDYHLARQRQNPAGVLCPSCGKELNYDGNELTFYYPPQRQVHCDNCNFDGLKVE